MAAFEGEYSFYTKGADLIFYIHCCLFNHFLSFHTYLLSN